MSWFDALAELVRAHQQLAYLLVFVFAFWESIPVFGVFVPGSTLIVGASILVPTGAIELVPVLLASIGGSIAGDTVAFWMGRRYGRDLLRWGPMARRSDMVNRAENFLRRHGGKGVVLGRFVAPVRGILPAIGGMAGMTWLRFFPAAVIAAIGWAPAHVLPGALIGASLELAGAVTARLGGLMLFILVAAYLVFVVVRLALVWGLPAGTRSARRLLIWGRAHNTMVGREVLALFDPAHREARTLAVLGTLLLVGAAGFFVVLEDIVSGDPLVRADAAIFRALQGLRSPWADDLMVAMTEVGDAQVTLPVAVAGFLWLAGRRAWVDAAYWAGAIVFAQLFSIVVKVALHTPRPLPGLYEGWSAFSFPSGHATVNAVLYGFLAVMVTRQRRIAVRSAIVGTIAVLVGLIALSRLYLGAHWFSDVAAGLGFGAAWVGLLGIAYIRHRSDEGQTRGLLPVAALTLAVAGTANIALSHPEDLSRYRPRADTRTMPAPDWTAEAWRSLPSHRIDLAGEIEEPFVLQWGGPVEALAEALAPAGWRAPVRWSMAGYVVWLYPAAAPGGLPVLPKLHDGLRPALTLLRPDPAGGSRLVLRVWTSRLTLDTEQGILPVHVATATREVMRRPLDLMTLAVAEEDANAPRDTLAAALRGITRRRDEPPQGEVEWDGVLLLAGPGVPK